MAASATDMFAKGARRFSTTLAGGGIADASTTTMTLTNTSGLPTDTAVWLVIDRVDSDGNLTTSLEEAVRGVVSGSNVINLVRGAEGTAQAHSAGAVVEAKYFAGQHDRMIDGLLVEHNQNGTHGDVTATSADISGTFTVDGESTINGPVTETVYDNGNSSTADTIDLSNGKYQKSTLTGTCTYTLTNFSAGSVLRLTIIVDGTGGYSAPTISASGVTFYHDDNDITLTANARNVVVFNFHSATECHINTASGLTSTTTI